MLIADNTTQLDCLIQKYVWGEIGKLDSSVVNVVLDELMRAAVDGGVSSSRCERVADTMGAISSINVRGRILARLRKVSFTSLHLHCPSGLTLDNSGDWEDIYKTDQEPC